MFTFDLQVAACCMLDDLDRCKLHVIKIRKDGGWVRLAIESNPDWYRNFCSEYMKRRRKYPKIRTLIKRCHTINALRKIANDSDIMTPYVCRLLPYVDDYTKQYL